MTIGMIKNKPTNIKSTNTTSVMDAANTLTSFVEEETYQSHASENGREDAGSTKTSSEGSNVRKRYLPDHKKPDAALTFPEKLMAMMNFAEQQKEGFCISWLVDGKSFIVIDAETFTKQVVPKFFKPTKFSSFTRKLYRWGFRQINRGIGQDDPIIFGNEHFQRGQPELMAKMRSTTAAATRKAEEISLGAMQMQMPTLGGMKRSSESAQIELQQQILLRQLLSKKARVAPQQQQELSMGPAMFSNPMSQSSVVNSQSCFSNGCNGNNPMSLSQMIHAGNPNSLNFNTGSTGVSQFSQSQHHQFNTNNNSTMFMEQQQQMMKMQQQQQQQNDSLLGSFNMQQDIMGSHQFMQQDKMMGCYNQFMPQEKMSGFNQFIHDMPQDKMMGGTNHCYMQQSPNDSSLLGQFTPSRRQQNSNYLQSHSGMVQDFPHSATTADIVNAAIQALKYS